MYEIQGSMNIMRRYFYERRSRLHIKGNSEYFNCYSNEAKSLRDLVVAFYTSRHICIVGPPGSGKTTLARKLSKLLKRPIVQMDDLVYEFSLQTGRAPKHEEWPAVLETVITDVPIISEGFYASSILYRFQSADIIIYYNLPRWRCLSSALIRGIKNIVVSTSAHPETRVSFSSRIIYAFSPRLYWRITRFYSAYDAWLLQYFEQSKQEKVILEIGSRTLSDFLIEALYKEIAL